MKTLSNLDKTDKFIIIVWLIWVGFVDGIREAHAFQYLNASTHNLPFYLLAATIEMISILAIVPLITRERTDWLFVIGGGFFLQLVQDMSHWFGRAFFIRNWTFRVDPLWTPLWDLLGVDFPFPLFYIIDIIIIVIVVGIWWWFLVEKE